MLDSRYIVWANECSLGRNQGAVTSGVLEQAQRLSGGQDAITISVGGNDVDFVSLLNHCVYTFFSRGKCDEQIAATERLIDELPEKLALVYDEAVSKLSDQGTIYVTGYAHFFDDTTNECDEVSLNVWGGVIGVALDFQQYLTVERRRQMNSLVDKLNDKTAEAIKAAVDKHGDKFEQVLYDYYFGEFEGRFCMPGVHEPAPNRYGLMFYLHGIDGEPGEHDDGVNHDDLKVRDSGLIPDAQLDARQFDSPAYPPGTFEAEVFELVVEGSKHLVDNEGADPDDPQIKRTLLPDWVARVFHPTISGHGVIANKVLHHMARRRARQLNMEEPPEVVETGFGSCPRDDDQDQAPDPDAPPAKPEPIAPPFGEEPGCFPLREGMGGTDTRSVTEEWLNTIDINADLESPGDCLRRGDTLGSDGSVLSHWCVLLEHEDFALVLADKNSNWGGGATGSSTIKAGQLRDLAYWSSGACYGTNRATAAMGGRMDLGQSLNSICMVSKDHPEICGLNWGVRP